MTPWSGVWNYRGAMLGAQCTLVQPLPSDRMRSRPRLHGKPQEGTAVMEPSRPPRTAARGIT